MNIPPWDRRYREGADGLATANSSEFVSDIAMMAWVLAREALPVLARVACAG